MSLIFAGTNFRGNLISRMSRHFFKFRGNLISRMARCRKFRGNLSSRMPQNWENKIQKLNLIVKYLEKMKKKWILFVCLLKIEDSKINLKIRIKTFSKNKFRGRPENEKFRGN